MRWKQLSLPRVSDDVGCIISEGFERVISESVYYLASGMSETPGLVVVKSRQPPFRLVRMLTENSEEFVYGGIGQLMEAEERLREVALRDGCRINTVLLAITNPHRLEAGCVQFGNIFAFEESKTP